MTKTQKIAITLLSLIGLALSIELCIVFYNANFAQNAAPSIVTLFGITILFNDKFLQKAYADSKLKIAQRDFERPFGITKWLNCDEVNSEESGEVEVKQEVSEEEEEEFY